MCVQKNKRNLDRGRISDSSAATQTALRKIPFFFPPHFRCLSEVLFSSGLVVLTNQAQGFM